jgi:hypothetical protein
LQIHTFDAINETLVLLDPIHHNTITIPQFDDPFKNGFDKIFNCDKEHDMKLWNFAITL